MHKFTALISLTLALVSIQPAVCREKTEMGWVLHQKSKVTGAHQLTITQTRMRIDNLGYGVTVICSLPSMKVTAYSTRKKLLFNTTPSAYRGMPAAYVFGNIRTDMQNGRWRDSGQTTVAGRLADVSVMSKSRMRRRETSRFEVEHANGVQSAVYKSMAGLKIPDCFALILARLYALPAYQKLPMEVVYTDPLGAENLSLFTTSCQKKEISLDTFHLPKGSKYKTARQEDDLYISKSRDAALEAGINWLGDVGDVRSHSWNRTEPARLKGESHPAYVLQQESKVMGKQIVQVSADGLYMVNPENGFSIILAKPRWNVVTYSRASESYIECPLDQYRGFRIKRIADVAKANFQTVPVYCTRKTETTEGIKALEYVSIELLPEKELSQIKNASTLAPTLKLTDGEASAVNYKVLDSPTFPPQISRFLAKFYAVPATQGLPLKLRYRSARRKVYSNLLVTDSVTRKDGLRIPSQLSGYRQVKSEKELFGDRYAEGAMEDFIDYMDTNTIKKEKH